MLSKPSGTRNNRQQKSGSNEQRFVQDHHELDSIFIATGEKDVQKVNANEVGRSMVSDQQAMHIVSQGISIEDGSETSPVNIITSQNDKIDQHGSLEKFLSTKRTSIKKV